MKKKRYVYILYISFQKQSELCTWFNRLIKESASNKVKAGMLPILAVTSQDTNRTDGSPIPLCAT